MMPFQSQFKQFNKIDTLSKLLIVNIALFLVVNLIIIGFRLFNLSADNLLSFLAIPADLHQLLKYPWTLISYMFLHEQLYHIFFNMVSLYWFAKIFLIYFNPKQLLALYFIGGFSGAIAYLVSFNIFPYFSTQIAGSILLGASASVMAIILATAVQAPNMQIRLIILGNISLKFIAAFVVLTSLFGVTSSNSGGEIAHLGGALAGYIFVVYLRKGKDITKGLNKLFDLINDIFKPTKLKTSKSSGNKSQRMSDGDFNANKAKRMQDIDIILDKIKSSGYESLTADEKRRLFEQRKE